MLKIAQPLYQFPFENRTCKLQQLNLLCLHDDGEFLIQLLKLYQSLIMLLDDMTKQSV